MTSSGEHDEFGRTTTGMLFASLVDHGWWMVCCCGGERCRPKKKSEIMISFFE